MKIVWLFLLTGAAASACNPTHTDQVDALGAEPQGVRNGPNHRAGQPCLVCHDGAIGDPSAFSIAGTIFERGGGATPASGTNVQLTDATGSSRTATTNEAGNFYITPSQWTPHYPVTVSVTAGSGATIPMQSLISRDGSCAGCHVDPVGPGSPGRVVLVLEDGGTPP